MNHQLNRPLFDEDPEVRILGYGKEEIWKQIFTRSARTCCSDGVRTAGEFDSQSAAIKYTERLADAGPEPSVGMVGARCDSALAETMIDPFKAEVIHSWDHENSQMLSNGKP